MGHENFHALCESLFGCIGVTAPQLAHDAQGTASLSMQLDGVDVTLAHFPQRSPDSAVALLELGSVPQAHELAAWLALMNINFLMRGDGAISFGRNPQDGQAILQCVYPFREVSGPGLQASLARMTRLVKSWRNDFFLEDAVQPGSPPVAVPAGPHDLL
jgi:hypothetical protein